MSTQVILLERVDNLGNMGEIVSVKPGYARNYLLPQKKALRANKANVAYFEAQKASLEAENAKRRDAAAKDAKKIADLNVAIIRQASEGGQLYGSVTARDIADAIQSTAKVTVEKAAVKLNTSFKTIGLFPVVVALHPEVPVDVTINIARSEEEAAIQQETGRAVTEEAPVVEEETTDTNLEAALEDTALEAEKAKAEAEAEEAAAAEVKAAEKAEKKAAKAAAKAEDEADAEAEEASEEAAE